MKKALLALAVALAASGPTLGDDLLKVYGLAAENDARVREARATRDAAQESVPLARSQLLPNVAVTGSVARNRLERKQTGTTLEYNNPSAAASVTQPIYRRDRLFKLDQSKNVAAQADAQLTAEEQDLIVRVSRAYFDVLGGQDTLEAAKSNRSAIARQLEQAKQRFEVGLDAITSVHEAQARYDQSLAEEIRAQNALEQSWEALRQIIGDRPKTIARLKPEIPLQPPSPADEAHWSEAAQQNNPAIQAAMQAADAAKQEIEVQRSGYYPSLDAVASYQMNRFTGLPDLGPVGSESLSDVDRGAIGLQLTVPIFQGGATSAGTRQASYQYRAKQDALDGVRRSIDKNVRDAYRGVVLSISQVKALKATTVSAQSALEATQAGYEVGTRTLVDVLNFQRDLYVARRDYALARYTYLVAGIALKQAAGNVTREDLALINSLLKE
ncbi:MAG: TolC family outer membrane protein [Gammaproteobacteria bacterium]|jgi:outer membrane protein|nr:TolC family outer membrane protein [Gammaproteobacteria bacterium]